MVLSYIYEKFKRTKDLCPKKVNILLNFAKVLNGTNKWYIIYL